MKKPKIVQITTAGDTVYGLSDRGKLYRFHVQAKMWVSLEDSD